jgi:alpha-beta hydrolase superfamily lysophospholipase
MGDKQAKKRLAWYWRGLRAVVVGYIAVGVLLGCCQSRLIYFPDAELIDSPASVGYDYQDVWLTTEDGETIHSWVVPAKKPIGVVLIFHGNAGNISHRMLTLRIFHDMDLTCMIIDYRGYGRSSGSPDEAGTYRDADAAWAHLTQRYKPEEIVIFGRSLGGAVAANLASRVAPAGLILESSFASVPAMARDMLPLFWLEPFLQYEYNTLEIIDTIGCPLLVIHSPDDEIIPYAQGQSVFNAAREPKQFLELQGPHNSGFLDSLPTYTPTLKTFIQKALQRKTK